MSTIKILGMVGEGTCEHCGTNCPRRRVAVQVLQADGTAGPVARWGIVCAGQARYGSRSTGNGTRVRRAAEQADHTAMLERRDREARYRQRTAGAVPEGVSAADAANIRYRATGRPLQGSYLMTNAAGDLVRVDGNDPRDVAMFTDAGFAARPAKPAATTPQPAGPGPIGRAFAAALVRCLDAAATVAADWRDALNDEIRTAGIVPPPVPPAA